MYDNFMKDDDSELLNKAIEIPETLESLTEKVKKAVVDFCNREYGENYAYNTFDEEFPDISQIQIAHTETENGEYAINFQINLKDYEYRLCIDDTPIRIDKLVENSSKEEALKLILNDLKYGKFDDFVSVDEKDLYREMGLKIDDDGNYYREDKMLLAVQVGAMFTLLDKEQLDDIKVTKTDYLLKIDQENYPLYKGKTYQDEFKIETFIDENSIKKEPIKDFIDEQSLVEEETITEKESFYWER